MSPWNLKIPSGHLAIAQPTSYQGCGDFRVWDGYWGLRAYSAATIGTNALHLVRNDAATATIVTVAGGGLDMASVNSFMSGHTAKVDTLFDQTGNGHDLTQSTDAKRPAFLL